MILSSPPPPPPYPVEAELFFLPAGHFLFRQRDGERLTSKFVTLADVAAAFTDLEQDSGWLPPGLLRTGYGVHGRFCVYVAPPQALPLRLVDGDREETLTVPLPATLLVGVGVSYYLAALEGADFHPDRPLYHAPWPNVHPSGQICWGEVSPPPAQPEYLPAAWRLFFASAFNGHLVSGKSRRHPDDVRRTLRAVAGKPRYPVKSLVACSPSAGRWVEKLLGGPR